MVERVGWYDSGGAGEMGEEDEIVVVQPRRRETRWSRRGSHPRHPPRKAPERKKKAKVKKQKVKRRKKNEFHLASLAPVTDTSDVPPARTPATRRAHLVPGRRVRALARAHHARVRPVLLLLLLGIHTPSSFFEKKILAKGLAGKYKKCCPGRVRLCIPGDAGVPVAAARFLPASWDMPVCVALLLLGIFSRAPPALRIKK